MGHGDGHTSCLLLAESSDELRGNLNGSRSPDWREAEVRERTAWESLVTGGVTRDMALEAMEEDGGDGWSGEERRR